jgi:SAM-dependent methyltransferase
LSVARGRPSASWEGALQILRFNWPDYLAALAVCAAATAVLALPRFSAWRVPAAAALAGTLYLVVASLAASHWIYDRSALADWRFVHAWLPPSPGRWMLIQSGFDSTHGRLARLLPPSPLPVLDLYGTLGVDGASVRRARRLAEHEGQRESLGSLATELPSEPATVDAFLAIFALHEVRDRATREAFFRRMASALAPGGQLLLIEHLRDWRNFLVFGFGFVHFLSERTWRTSAEQAGLQAVREARITPFVRVLLWTRPLTTQ